MQMKTTDSLIVGIIILMSLSFSTGCAATETICPCDADAEVNTMYPDDNYGDSDHWGAGTNEYADDAIMRSFVRFNFSGIPDGATVTEVSFYGWVSSTTHIINYDYYFYAVAKDWQEMTVTWNNQPPAGEEVLAVLPTPDTFGIWVTAPFSAYGLQVVQGWVEVPESNLGCAFVRESEGEMNTDRTFFDSREWENPSYLLVVWQSPETVQPESLGMLKAMFL